MKYDACPTCDGPKDARAAVCRSCYHSKKRAKAQHGTRSRYVAGCRCDDCKRAHAMYERRRRAWTKDVDPEDDSGPGRALTVEQVRHLTAVVDMGTACRALGIGYIGGLELAKRGEFPIPLIELKGHRPASVRYRVPTAPLLRLLGIEEEVR